MLGTIWFDPWGNMDKNKGLWDPLDKMLVDSDHIAPRTIYPPLHSSPLRLSIAGYCDRLCHIYSKNAQVKCVQAMRLLKSIMMYKTHVWETAAGLV